MSATAVQEEIGALVDPAFVERMEAELRANAHKGDWREWRPDARRAKGELRRHVHKLLRALDAGLPGDVSEYAADVANVCMMIEALYGESHEAEK